MFFPQPFPSPKTQLKCKSFQWYLENIATYMYVPLPTTYSHRGALRNLASGTCIYTEGVLTNEEGILHSVLRSCQQTASSLQYHITKHERGSQVRHENIYGSRCLIGSDVKEGSKVNLARCYDWETVGDDEYWTYNANRQLVHKQSGLCVAAESEMSEWIVFRRCKKVDRKQMWEVDEVSW